MTIGDKVGVGAGAVVSRDIPSNSVAVGLPARVIKSVDAYAEKTSAAGDNTKHLSPDEKCAFYPAKVARKP